MIHVIASIQVKNSCLDDCLENGRNIRYEKLTDSIAVGSEGFIEKLKDFRG